MALGESRRLETICNSYKPCNEASDPIMNLLTGLPELPNRDQEVEKNSKLT